MKAAIFVLALLASPIAGAGTLFCQSWATDAMYSATIDYDSKELLNLTLAGDMLPLKGRCDILETEEGLPFTCEAIAPAETRYVVAVDSGWQTGRLEMDRPPEAPVVIEMNCVRQ
jgi:hypothetical protein